MMQHMGSGMMVGMGASMLFWIVLATIVALLLIGACLLLVANLLKNQKKARTPSGPQPQDGFAEYAQGYEPQKPVGTETYQESGQLYPYQQPQYEQPEVQHSRE